MIRWHNFLLVSKARSLQQPQDGSFRNAAGEIDGFFKLAQQNWAAGRRGPSDLN